MEDGQFRVLTGLRQADGSVVAVVRGVVLIRMRHAPPERPGATGRRAAAAEEHVPGAGLAERPDCIRPLARLAQQWPGPLIDGFVNLSGADATSQGLAPAACTCPRPWRLRNGAYAMQWWLFAAFTLVMAFRMARRHRASSDAEVVEITPERPVEPT